MKKHINIDDRYLLVFTGKEFVVRKKSTLNGDRVAKDPRFERTRQNGREFGYACKAANMIRSAFKRHFCWKTGDDRRRLIKTIMEALKADPEHNPGNRTVTEAESARLAEFGFNKEYNLSETLPWRSYKLKVSRKNGIVQMNIAANAFRHTPCRSAKATHFRVGLLALVVDFEAPQWVAESAVFSGYLPLNQEAPANIALLTKLQIPEGSTVLVGVALEYFTDDDGALCPLPGGSGNAVEIVEVY